MGHHGVTWPIYVIILLTCLAKCSMSLPINDQVIDAGDSCEFGDILTTYDESCPNGATGILPCNPGQLKIAECIGQDGDTSRMCDPCPQKYYQSFYNRCTECHRCSECGSNGRIKQLCTNKTDNVCESIIPPDPVTTTTPTQTADAPVPSLSTQNIDESTPRVPDATTAASTPQTTRKGPFYTEGPVLTITTTQNISVLESGTSVNRGIDWWKTVAISVIVLFPVLFLVVVIILVVKICKQRATIMKQKRELRSCTCKSNGNNIPMKTGDSGLPRSPASSNVNTPENEYVCQVELDQCEDSGQMQRTDNGSLPSRMARQEAVQSSVGDDGNESECNMESHDKIVPDRINLSNADLCRDGNGGGDHGERDIDDRPHVGGRDQDSEPNRTTVLADIHIPPENVHDTDTHTDAPSRPKPSLNYENLNGKNQTNMGAPSTSGGSGSEDSDGSRATGPEQDDGGAIADPPKTLHSTTPRPKQEGLLEADPLMQQQASPEVVTKMKKEQKRKGIMGSLIPGRKMLKKVYSAVPLEDSSLSSKAENIPLDVMKCNEDAGHEGDRDRGHEEIATLLGAKAGQNSCHPSGSASGHPSGGASSHLPGGASLHLSGGASGHPSGGASGHPSGGASSHLSGGASLHPSGSASGHPSGGASSHPSGGASGHPSVGASGHLAGGASLHPSGSASGHPSGGASVHPSGSASVHSSGGASGHPSGGASVHSSGDASGHPSSGAGVDDRKPTLPQNKSGQ